MKTNFKKVLSVLLCLAMLMTTMSVLAGAAGGNELKFYVASDLHFIDKSQQYDLDPNAETSIDNDIYYYANPLGKMFHESEAILRSMLDDFVASDAPYLLIPGDLCDNGVRLNQEKMASILKEYEDKSGKKIFVIAGNHDLGGSTFSGTFENSIDYNEFKEIYADLGYNEALAVDENSASYTADLSNGYRLLAIDSNDPGMVAGNVRTSVIEWIKEQLAQAEEDGVHVVAMMHHSLLSHFTLNTTIAGGFDDMSAQELAKLLADNGVKYVFTGHLHVNDITMATTIKGNQIYDVATGCLIVAPNMFRKVSMNDDKVTMEACYVDSIDTQYLCNGYSQEQLDLINSDFAAYSDSYCKYGLYGWLETFLTADNLLKDLDKDNVAYKAVDEVLSNLRDVLRFPIYDSGTPEIDSIEEIAALTGNTVPASDYETVIDLAYIYVHSFYAGDNNIKADSLEATVLLSAVKAAIAYAIGQTTDLTALGQGLNKVFAGLGYPAASLGFLATSGVAKLTYAKTVANIIIKSILTPFLESFSDDAYAPGDLNVTLPSYTQEGDVSFDGDSGLPLSFLQRIIVFLQFIFDMVSKIVNR